MKFISFFAKSATIGAALISHIAISAPHWPHDEQAEWGAIEDASQTITPLMYPYAECSIGTHQSPVNLGGENNTHELNTLKVEYTEDKPDFFNSGHAVQVNSSSHYHGQLKIGNDIYPLIQYHFHAPSEHVINGKSFPAELHFVHIREDGRIAALGVLLEERAANETVQTVLDNTLAPSEHNANTGIEINPRSLLPHDVKWPPLSRQQMP
jgi:carbonic anhydrase